MVQLFVVTIIYSAMRFANFIFCLILVQDIVHDLDTQAEDWHMAMEALCEVNFLYSLLKYYSSQCLF